MIDIDGAQGEGGGQILRTSLALALITGQAFRLRNLRAGRDKPGLRPQHLAGVHAAAALGQAKTHGATLGSSALVFEPGQVKPGNYHFTIGTAGATPLVLHTVYLPLACASEPSHVTIEGGTHVRGAPCYHFLSITWARYLERLGLRVDLDMRRTGFYPRGGGLIEATIHPWTERAGLTIDEVPVPTRVKGFSAVAGLPEHILRRQAERLRERLAQLDLDADVREETWKGGPGTVVGVELPTQPVPTSFFAIGERGKPAERVADDAAQQVRAFLKADPLGIDEHSADQMVLPLALAAGPSWFPVAAVSSHLLTNVTVIGHFLKRAITVEGKLGKSGIVRIG